MKKLFLLLILVLLIPALSVFGDEYDATEVASALIGRGEVEETTENYLLIFGKEERAIIAKKIHDKSQGRIRAVFFTRFRTRGHERIISTIWLVERNSEGKKVKKTKKKYCLNRHEVKGETQYTFSQRTIYTKLYEKEIKLAKK